MYNIERVKAALRSYPVIWFDNNTMSFLVDYPRRVITRIRMKLVKESFIEENGRYFKLKQIDLQ